MDQGFLLHPEVVTSAKKFVCIRLTSYENEAEKQFVARMSGREPANTSFAILNPEGNEYALRGRGPGRGPRDLFPDAPAMAKGMDALAAKYPLKEATSKPSLPVTLNVKVGLAVAAADLLPLVLVLAPSAKRQDELEAKVAERAWAADFAGRFTYASTTDTKELAKLTGNTLKDGILIIEPDIFGATGKVVGEVPASQLAKLGDAFKAALKSHVKLNKTRRDLANRGLKEGIYYETGIEVSGRGEATDRARYKQMLDFYKKKE